MDSCITMLRGRIGGRRVPRAATRGSALRQSLKLLGKLICVDQRLTAESLLNPRRGAARLKMEFLSLEKITKC